jgi:hypothetical protein
VADLFAKYNALILAATEAAEIVARAIRMEG